ncbi:MAG TPA: DNA polymerase III subunit delta' [Chloroflexi bacterium]|nr:DNA polymerase III subunit delta' [Chloroflexota bacterium]
MDETWQIVGHRLAVQQLRLMVIRDEVPHALLIIGPPDIGKETLALTLARALLCTAPVEARPCNACSACRRVDSGNHPDLLRITPEEALGNVKIEQIRSVGHFLALRPSEARHKVALIADFERATTSAANALLKTLEEPPAYAHLILLATDADTLLPTIVSRAQQIALRPLDRETVRQALQTRWSLPPDVAARLARLSGGRMGWAVRAATDSQAVQQLETAVALLFEVLRSGLPERFAAAKQLAQDDALVAQTFAYWQVAWRDVLLLQTATDSALTFQEQRGALQQVADQVTPSASAVVLRQLETGLEALARHANTQLLVENLLLRLPPVAL